MGSPTPVALSPPAQSQCCGCHHSRARRHLSPCQLLPAGPLAAGSGSVRHVEGRISSTSSSGRAPLSQARRGRAGLEVWGMCNARGVEVVKNPTQLTDTDPSTNARLPGGNQALGCVVVVLSSPQEGVRDVPSSGSTLIKCIWGQGLPFVAAYGVFLAQQQLRWGVLRPSAVPCLAVLCCWHILPYIIVNCRIMTMARYGAVLARQAAPSSRASHGFGGWQGVGVLLFQFPPPHPPTNICAMSSHLTAPSLPYLFPSWA